MANLTNTTSLSSWQMKGIGILRIVFGLIWAVDAWFKWQPDFINKFADYLTGALEGQPVAVQAWINFWIGALLTLVSWSTAEGFGGPYVPGSADIGSAIIYTLVFAALFLVNAGSVMGLDPLLTPVLGRLGFLASPPLQRQPMAVHQPSKAN